MWTWRVGWTWPSGYGGKNLLGRDLLATEGNKMGMSRGSGGSLPHVAATEPLVKRTAGNVGGQSLWRPPPRARVGQVGMGKTQSFIKGKLYSCSLLDSIDLHPPGFRREYEEV